MFFYIILTPTKFTYNLFLLGRLIYVALLLLSGLTGNLFSASFGYSCGISVGASTCILGILGFQIIWFIVFWPQFGPSKFIYAIYLAIITGTMLFGGFTNESNIDAWGHIGGFTSGIWFTISVYKLSRQIRYLKMMRIPWLLILIMIYGLTIALSMTKNIREWPPKIW